MKVALVITTYNRAEMFTRAVATARETTQAELTFYLFLHSQYKDVVKAFEEQRKEEDAKLFAYGFNRGLARSWNEGILKGYEEGADVVIVASDSAWYSPDDIDKIAAAAMKNRHRAQIRCAGFATGSRNQAESNLHPVANLGYGCFALNPVALEKVGCFDENFWPYNLEDMDYFGRLRLAPLGIYIVPDTKVCRISSASKSGHTSKEKEQFKVWSNLEYYKRKWGRTPWARGAPVYLHPFDSPEFSWVITPENRHAPYPGHNKPERTT